MPCTRGEVSTEVLYCPWEIEKGLIADKWCAHRIGSQPSGFCRSHLWAELTADVSGARRSTNAWLRCWRCSEAEEPEIG